MDAVVSLLRSNGVSNRPVGDLTVASLGGRSRYRIDVSTVRKYGGSYSMVHAYHFNSQPKSLSTPPHAVPDCFFLTSTGNLLCLSWFLLLQIESADPPPLMRTRWMSREHLSLQQRFKQ